MKHRALLGVLLLASCSESAPPDLAANKQAIWDTVKAYHEAGDKGDAEVMKSLLAPEASMLKGQEDLIRGADACAQELTERLKRLEGQSRSTLLGREHISVTGDTAYATYIASVGVQRAPITMVFRRSEGKWRIAHIHESWNASK